MADKTVVEINGVKLEVDLRTAKRVDVLRVGDKVKLLKKGSQYDSTKVYPGVIIGFEPFKSMPTILVAALVSEYASFDIKVIPITSETKDYEMVVSIDDELLDKQNALDFFYTKENKLMAEVNELREKRKYFERNFAKYWEVLDVSSNG